MKANGFLAVLTLVNLTILSFALVQGRPARANDTIPILRGRGLEIVDDQGKVRASITIFPTNPKFKTAEGKPYPETVLLRLINSKGGPNVKLSASEDGAGLGLGGASNPTYIQVVSSGDETFLNMINKDGRKQSLKPGAKDGPAPYFPSP